MKRSRILDQQRHFLSLLPHVRKQFEALTGVHIIGLGAKEKNGKLLEEWAFRFYIDKKKPLHDIPNKERIPKQIFGVQTDVIPYFEKESLICASSNLNVNDSEYRDDGIRGGISIRNEHFDNDQPSGYGTLGILARRKSDNSLVGLTCAHVVNAASDSITTFNTKIGQPKYWVSCCCCPRGYIGDVVKATSTNDLDCALIEIHDDIRDKVSSNSTENKVEGIGTDVSGAAAIICFDNLKKFGRATGLTTGKVSDIAYGTNHMLIELTDGNPGDPFACHGDSGAVIVNSSNQVVGLLVAAAQMNDVAGTKLALTKIIATHIKPVMIDLGITIAGTDASTITEPVGGGTTGCELHAWPGGQTDTALNPIETFNSSDFGFTGNIDWDVSKGAAGAVIIETSGQTASNRSSISVRYDAVSATKNPTDTVWIEAKKGSEPPVTKFRTIFKFTPRAVNTSNSLDSDNTKRFTATGGTNNQAGVAVPGTDGATWFLAKAEIVYDIIPSDLQWSGSGGISFEVDAPADTEGNIVARRQTKFTKGEQANGATNRTHTDQVDWISAGDSSADDFQEPTDALPSEVFRLANEGFDPTNLLQGYLRADFRDYLEFHDGTAWIRITSFAEWFANLTADQSGSTPPPGVGTINTIGAGTNTENIPNQQPTISVNAFQEVKPGEPVTLSSTPVDADKDAVTVSWLQTAGPAVALSSSTGNTVTFNAPANDPQLKFTATADDGTGTLSRTAGNQLSSAAEAIVNVIEWLDRQGGEAVLCVNNEEIFNAADFGIGGGALNWDVTNGGTIALIIEADGASIAPSGTVNGAISVKVNYNTVSANANRAKAVKIQATNPGNSKAWFKRRTVTDIAFAATTGLSLIPPSPASVAALGSDWGYTEDENITVTICAYRSGANWKAGLLTVTGNYSIQARLVAGINEVTGPGGNTAEANYCDQMNNLNSLNPASPGWYMLGAVQAHENVHATRLLPALNHATVLPVLRNSIEALSVPHAAMMTQATAITAIKALPGFAAALVAARTNWDAQYVVLITAGAGDHGGPTDVAERAVVTPMITAICAHSRANGWAACPPVCP